MLLLCREGPILAARSMHRLSHRFVLFGGAFIALAALYWPIERRVAAARLLSKMSTEDKAATPTRGQDVNELHLPDGTPIPARIYGPSVEKSRLSIVLAHGIHHKGIEEPRLVRFANHLAAMNCRVLTPELSELADYRVSRQGVQAIQTSVKYLTREGSEVGLIGFSFAGGLSLLAAAEPRIAENLKYVASIGGYHDLARSLRFLATNEVEGPTGTTHRTAHEYGLLVLLYGHVEHLELGADEPTFARTLRAWLMEDRPRARREAERLQGVTAQQLFALVNTGKLPTLRKRLLELINTHQQELRDLSPAGRLESIDTKLIFLHGIDDTVVPPEETLFAAQELEQRAWFRDHSLVTPLLRHVGVDHPGSTLDKVRLVNLMAQLF